MSTTIEDARRYLDQQRAQTARRHTSRNIELVLLCAVSAIVILLMWSANGAKTGEFADVGAKAAAKQLVNLNGGVRADDIAPLLDTVTKPEERTFIAEQIANRAQHGSFSHVGEVALLRVTGEQIAGRSGLDDIAARIAAATTGHATLLTRTELHDVKPFFIVRTPDQFRRTFWLYVGAFVLAFVVLHVFWRLKGFAGDQLILPAIEILCGLGMVLMFSIGDPLRDTLMFVSFCNGIFMGAAAMLVLSLLDYNRRFRRFSYTFIAATALLGVLIWAVGNVPSCSDAWVELFVLCDT